MNGSISVVFHFSYYVFYFKHFYLAPSFTNKTHFIFTFPGSIISFGGNGYEFEVRYYNSGPQGEVLKQHWFRIWT